MAPEIAVENYVDMLAGLAALWVYYALPLALAFCLYVWVARL
jgi:hypothetical protein